MKKLISSIRMLLPVVLFAGIQQQATAQCIAGFNQAQLNWDYLDYFSYMGNYTSANGYLSSNLESKTQPFAFGTQQVTFVHNYADASALGENGTHTGDGSSYGTGDDIQFIGNGVITITFDIEVRNLKFSLFDIDRNQRANITATNAANTSQLVTMSKANLLSASISVGLPAFSVTAIATSATLANNVSTNTVNVDIAGPVKKITITISNTSNNGSEDGSFWISDLTACSPGAFSTNYYNVSRPFTGQPGYILQSLDRDVYILNPVTGKAKLLFEDNTTPLGTITASNRCFINSMAYDPYNRVLYYVYSLSTDPGANRLLRKYDLASGTITTVLTDISSTTYGVGVGIPLVTSTSGVSSRGDGVESGAAAFYDGALYIGIETTNKSSSGGTAGTSSREAVIWKIDFDASKVPYRASQVFAMPVDNGSGTLMHDWSDFTITNGVLYDFDGAGVTTETDVYHYNMQTGATVNYHKPGGWTPGQPTVGWDNTLYQLYATTASPAVSPYVATYNTGTIGTKIPIFSTPMYTPAIPSLGDAAEAFRPLADFGDAPASYDPVALSPAVNEKDTALHIGPGNTIEWTKASSVLANADAAEDGLAYVPIFVPVSANYVAAVQVYNNSGVNATLIGWLDYNLNGVFDNGEASFPLTIASMPTMQTVNLAWPLISSSLPSGSTTYLRIRFTSAANGMTATNATGYFNDGETEDYQVYVDNSPLRTQLLNFQVLLKSNDAAQLTWTSSEDEESLGYHIQKSVNSTDWTTIATVAAAGQGIQHYAIMDKNITGTTYYRLKLTDRSSAARFSAVAIVRPENVNPQIQISPNPAGETINLQMSQLSRGVASIRLLGMNGHEYYQRTIQITSDESAVQIAVASQWPAGVYLLKVTTPNGSYSQQCIIRK